MVAMLRLRGDAIGYWSAAEVRWGHIVNRWRREALTDTLYGVFTALSSVAILAMDPSAWGWWVIGPVLTALCWYWRRRSIREAKECARQLGKTSEKLRKAKANFESEVQFHERFWSGMMDAIDAQKAKKEVTQ